MASTAISARNGSPGFEAAWETAAVDAACAPTVTAFLVSAVVWLLVGSAFGFLASIKLHTPAFLGDCAWLTFGRVRAAHVHTTVYGWASLGGMGTLFWVQARHCAVRLPLARWMIVACMLWNVAVAGGTAAILTGAGTGIEYFAAPAVWSFVLAVVFMLLVLTTLMMLAGRRERILHVSQWYLIGATLWFPFLYLVAGVLLHGGLTRGLTHAATSWWYAHNLLGLWLIPIGLALAYDLIPRQIDRPIYSRRLALVGFYSLAVLYNWPGMHHLIDGPLPRWLTMVSAISGILMLIPVAAVAVNLHLTLRGHFYHLRREPALRFVVLGALCYAVVSVQGALLALRPIREITHFTHATVAHAHLGVYAFFSFMLFGAVYYLGPRLTRRQWQSGLLIDVHFWTAAVGIAVYWLGLTIGGLSQGLALRDPSAPFVRTVARTLPYLGVRSGAAYLLLIGHFVFAWLVFRMFVGRDRHTPSSGGVTA